GNCSNRSTTTCSSSGFFFSSRRRHTSSLRDWSSDVCSSDLFCGSVPGTLAIHSPLESCAARSEVFLSLRSSAAVLPAATSAAAEIGRASCRERVEEAEVGDARKREGDRGQLGGQGATPHRLA